MRILLIVIIAINVLFPSFSTFNHAYQTSLLTSGSRNLDRPLDIQFKFGPDIEGLKEWNRVKLGFPESPIIIDIQFKSKILQARIDTKGFLINLIPTYAILLFIWIKRLINRKNCC